HRQFDPTADRRYQACRYRGPEAKGGRWIVEGDLEPPCPREGIRLWCLLANLAECGDRGVELRGDLEDRSHLETLGKTVGNVDDGLAILESGHGDHRLAGRNGLPDLGVDGGDDAVELRPQFSVSELLRGLRMRCSGLRQGRLGGLSRQ